MPAGVAGGALDPVEGDLDDLLGPHVHDVRRRATVSSSVNRSVCQASISSVIPLNVLPSITNPPVAGSRAAEVDVGQPAPPPSAAPLDREHHQVEGVHRLDLDPGGAAAAGVVRRREVLDHDPLVAGPQAVVEERLRGGEVVGDQPGDPVGLRHQPLEGGQPVGAGSVEQVDAVEVQQVEEVRRDGDARRSGRCGTRSPGTGGADRSRRARAPRRRARTGTPAAPAPPRPPRAAGR